MTARERTKKADAYLVTGITAYIIEGCVAYIKVIRLVSDRSTMGLRIMIMWRRCPPIHEDLISTVLPEVVLVSTV